MTYSESDLVYILFEDDTDFFVHCTSDVSPTYTTDVTQNEVEEGADIADHARNNPITLTLTQFMSELEGQEQNEQYDPYFVGKHIELHERLLLAWSRKEFLNIDCGPEKGIFSEMMITSYTPNWNNAGDGKSLNFTLSLQQINFATTETRDLEVEKAYAESVAAFKERADAGEASLRVAPPRMTGITLPTRQMAQGMVNGKLVAELNIFSGQPL